MSLTIMAAVLGAAFLHALWNALIRLGGSKIRAMVMLSIAEALIGLVVALSRPMPDSAALGWILAAGVIHFGYKFFLAHAYEQGDLSRVYPIARGSAPMMVAVVSAALAIDAISGLEYAGIAVLGLGIALMARGVFTDGESRRLLPYALGSALATASYTLVDGMGARISGEPVGYVGWIMVLGGVFFAMGMVGLRGTVMLRAAPREWGIATLGAAASYAAYAISIWAMTRAPIALVATLRETSILFAVLIGWLVFGEKMRMTKALAALLIVSGVVLTRV
ncbi:DMT family transporter [Thioclava sp. JE_KL1]|uniref:DMT family transporter n=1 Tax=Thioclava sp. JE_KL1 TaxID=2651187 RepID=UPI00128CC59E|nr:DMT family transporter [Thioclava sp. JE_KL1]MPQ95955.1 EamA family transporter [Thioclava sp. JE_KL1]